jgi:hypothetical protein
MSLIAAAARPPEEQRDSRRRQWGEIRDAKCDVIGLVKNRGLSPIDPAALDWYGPAVLVSVLIAALIASVLAFIELQSRLRTRLTKAAARWLVARLVLEIFGPPWRSCSCPSW